MTIFIVATDLSARSNRAVAPAACHDANLALTHFDPEIDPAEAEDVARWIAERLPGAPAARAEIRVIAKPPETGAPAPAATLGADLMIVGAHARRALRDLALPSTGERMLRAGPCPVLVTVDPPRGPWRAGPAAVAFSRACEIAIETAARLAPGMPVDAVHAVHVIGAARNGHGGPAAAAAAEAEAPMAAFDARPAMPPFRRAIVVTVGARAAIRAGRRGPGAASCHDMVILGAHGHSRLRDFALGSIAHDMPRDPPRDLLIARD